jgi:hypothetical protein
MSPGKTHKSEAGAISRFPDESGAFRDIEVTVGGQTPVQAHNSHSKWEWCWLVRLGRLVNKVVPL